MKGIVEYTALWHAIHGVALTAGLAVSGITSLNTLHSMFGMFTGPIMLAASCLAWRWTYGKPVTWVLPQQWLLWIQAAGVLAAIFNGSYADGVAHPRVFISLDQLNVMLLAAVHTWIAFWKSEV